MQYYFSLIGKRGVLFGLLLGVSLSFFLGLTSVKADTGVTAEAITTGIFHACAVLNDHRITCWGDNTLGQLGNSTWTDSPIPVVVTGITTAVAVSAGERHACALLWWCCQMLGI